MLSRSVNIIRNHAICNFISLEQMKLMLPMCTQCRQKRTNPFSKEQRTILMKIFDYDHLATYNLMMKHKTLVDCDYNQIEKSVEILAKFGIFSEQIRETPTILTILPVTIEQHAMVLQEGGFNPITIKLLVRYLNVIRKRLSILKAYGYIPMNINVTATLLSHLEPELPPLKNDEEDDMTYSEIFQTVLFHYLQWKLKFTPEEMDKLPNTYKRIRHKSIRFIRRTLTILQNTVGFSNAKIRKHGYLIHSHPDNTLKTLQELPTLAGVDIKTMFDRYPKMIMTATPTLLKTLKHLKEFGITEEAVRKCPEILTLSSATVYNRLLQVRSTPQFNALSGHPRILRLVYYQIKAQSRLRYLQGINLKCASLHILSAPKRIFERHAQEGVDSTRGVDVVNYLSNTLGETGGVLRSSIQRHQYWCHVPIVSIKETLDALLKRGFTKKEIIHSIHILIYPMDRVITELDALPLRSELFEHQIVPYCNQLALCLYFMERGHHFTGDGIWETQDPATFPITPDSIQYS